MRLFRLGGGVWLAGTLFVSGCLPKTLGDDTGPLDSDDTGPLDSDGDGFSAVEDCDDTEALIHPLADEACDGLDNNCDGEIDEGVGTDWHPDVDGDGFGDSEVSTLACEAPSGHVEDGTDCNDENPDINPETTWYEDADGDGFGDQADDGQQACEATSPSVLEHTDCDDAVATTFPGAIEHCNELDDDCDGSVDAIGLVSFEDESGVWQEVSSEFLGTLNTPASVSLDVPGTWHVCAGTYYVNVVISESVSLVGHGTDRTDVVLDGAATERVVEVDTGEHVVSIENLTLTNGLAVSLSDIWGDTEGGGILCEGIDNGAHSSLLLTRVWVTENEGVSYSGGVGANRCDLTINDSEISNNSAIIAGGIGLFDSDGVIDGSEIVNNSADIAAGIGLVSTADSPELTLSNSTVKGNEAGSFSRGGGLNLSGAHFESIGNDWGDRGASGDNTPDDVYVEGIGLGFDYDSADWDFTCDSTGCSPGRYETDLGGTDYSASPWTFAARMRGNYMTLDTDTTLESFSMYLNPDSSCSGDALQFYLVEVASLPGSSSAQDWTVIWSAEVPISTTTEEDYSSGAIHEVLSAGGHYGFLAGWSCEVSYSGGGGDLMGTDVGPGTFHGGMGQTLPSPLVGVGNTLSLQTYSSTSSYGYQQTLSHYY